MAQTIKLKRSATASAIPSTAQLALGEIAINTFDGKLYLKKDNGTESVVEVLTSYTETDTLDSVTDRGATTTNAVTIGNLTSTGIDDNASATAVTIDSSGNVGIGAASPAAKLDVNGSIQAVSTTGTKIAFGATTFVSGSSTIADYGITYNDEGLSFDTNLAGFTNMKFHTNRTERLRISPNGNVGIGTTSPAGKFDVSGGRSWFTANNEAYSIAMRYSPSAGVMYMGATNSLSTPSIQFSNSGGAALATIDYNGNVGVGTTSPATALDVNGTITTDGLAVSGRVTEGVFAVTGSTPALSPTNGTIQTWTLAANSTPTFDAGFTSGASITLMIDDGAAYSITWPTTQWAGGSAPSLATTGYTVVALWRVGATFYGALVGEMS